MKTELEEYEDNNEDMIDDDEQPQYYQCMICSWAGYESDLCPNCCGPTSACWF